MSEGQRASTGEAAGSPGSSGSASLCRSCRSALCTSSAPRVASASWSDLLDERRLDGDPECSSCRATL